MPDVGGPIAHAVGIKQRSAVLEHVGKAVDAARVPVEQSFERGDGGAALEHVGHAHGGGGVGVELPFARLLDHAVGQHGAALEHGREVENLVHVPVLHARDGTEHRTALEHGGGTRGVGHGGPALALVARVERLELGIALEEACDGARLAHLDTSQIGVDEVGQAGKPARDVRRRDAVIVEGDMLDERTGRLGRELDGARMPA